MTIEKEKKNIPIENVSRAFPYASRTPQSILESLDRYMSNPNGRIPIIEVFLAHKTKKSQYSSDHLSPIGGKMFSDESAFETAYRKINEESTLKCFPLKEENNIRFSIKDSFNYDVISKNQSNEKRKVYFSVIPVINPEIVTSIYPIQENSKIDGLFGLSIEELSQAFDTGQHTDKVSGKTFPLQGHITKLKEVPDIILSKGHKQEKNYMLDKVMQILTQQELRSRSALYDSLAFFAIKMGFSQENLPVASLKVTEKINEMQKFQRIENKSDKLEELLIILKNNFGDKFNQLFTEAYSTLLGRLYTNYFRNQEEKNKKRSTKRKKIQKKEESINQALFYEADEIKKRMVNGNFSQDVLHFLPLFINMEQSVKGKTTHLIIGLARFMRDLTKKICTEGPYKSLDELKEFFLDKNILLENKLEYGQKFNERLINILAKTFHTDQKSISAAWTLASRFIPNLAEETKNADPELSRLYQFHELRNEIANSSLGQAFLLALKVDLKDNGTDWQIIKFEALKQLVFFLKILFEKPIYENVIKKKPHPVDLGINTFFGPVIDKKIIILNSNGIERKMPMTYRRSLNGDEFIVDEKPVKSLESTIRKSLEENVEDIADIQSCAVVLPNELYKHLSSEKRIDFINQQADGFVEFLKSNYPSWQTNIMEDKNTFNNYEAAIKGEKVSKEGKRTGSKGDLLIRRKVKLKMFNKKTKDSYNYELVFYPFENFSKMLFPKGKEHIMGWKEKIEDDPTYTLQRMLFPLRGAFGLKSLYELLFPPSLYPELIGEIRKSNSVNVFKHTSP